MKHRHVLFSFTPSFVALLAEATRHSNRSAWVEAWLCRHPEIQRIAAREGIELPPPRQPAQRPKGSRTGSQKS